MIRFVVLNCLLLTLVAGQSTDVSSQCQRHFGVWPLRTIVEGCTSTPCTFNPGQDVVIHMIFRAPRNVTSMRTEAVGYFIMIPIPFDLQENAETCNFLQNTTCPLQNWELVQYTLRMHIDPMFPVGIQLTFEFQVDDEKGDPLICTRVPTVFTARAEKK